MFDCRDHINEVNLTAQHRRVIESLYTCLVANSEQAVIGLLQKNRPTDHYHEGQTGMVKVLSGYLIAIQDMQYIYSGHIRFLVLCLTKPPNYIALV